MASSANPSARSKHPVPCDPPPKQRLSFNLRLIAQNHVQQGTVDFNLAVVINKPQLPKFVHEKTDARSRCADHLREGLLADFCYYRLRPIAGSQKCDHGFFPLLGHDRLLDLAALNEENGIRRIALPVDNSILPIIGIARPPFTFERNTLGSNRTFPLRFIAGTPYRVGVPLTRVDRTRLHAKATSGTRWFPCHRSHAELAAELLGEAFAQPAAELGIGASKIDPLAVVGDRPTRSTPGCRALTTVDPHKLAAGSYASRTGVLRPRQPIPPTAWILPRARPPPARRAAWAGRRAAASDRSPGRIRAPRRSASSPRRSRQPRRACRSGPPPPRDAARAELRRRDSSGRRPDALAAESAENPEGRSAGFVSGCRRWRDMQNPACAAALVQYGVQGRREVTPWASGDSMLPPVCGSVRLLANCSSFEQFFGAGCWRASRCTENPLRKSRI
jgi:hypothetical protein